MTIPFCNLSWDLHSTIFLSINLSSSLVDYSMPIRLTQNSALGHDPVHVRLPRKLRAFQKLFPDEAACASHMERIEWSERFKYPYCGQVGDPYRIKARPRVLECR